MRSFDQKHADWLVERNAMRAEAEKAAKHILDAMALRVLTNQELGRIKTEKRAAEAKEVHGG